MSNFARVKTVLALLSAMLLFAGCSGESAKTSDAPRTIVVGVSDEFPPMGYRSASGEIIGFDIDLIHEVATRLDCKMELYVIAEWGHKETLLNDGTIDCIWNGLTITPERAKTILFTPPYLENFQVFMVREKDGYKSVNDLQGKRLGVEIGSTGEAAIAQHAEWNEMFTERKKYPIYGDAVTALANEEIDALVVDSIVAVDCIQYKNKSFKILDDIIAVEEYGIGFRLGYEKLRDEIWSKMKELEADGTAAKISQKWFGHNLSVIEIDKIRQNNVNAAKNEILICSND